LDVQTPAARESTRERGITQGDLKNSQGKSRQDLRRGDTSPLADHLIKKRPTEEGKDLLSTRGSFPSETITILDQEPKEGGTDGLGGK